MPTPENFAAFILTNGRPDRVHTFKSLRKHGFTGRIYLVIDDEDRTRDEYIDRFGAENVLIFSKEEVSKTFDEGDNFGDRRAIIYARNACFDLARAVGVRYFIQLDDDYTDFRYKTDREGRFVHRAPIVDLDAVLEAFLAFYRATPALSVAFAQGGDFIGGEDGQIGSKSRSVGWPLLRKCMNSFLCDVERRFNFVGRVNEDVNTYTSLARRGGLFLTVPMVALQQMATQQNSGGMTELYRDSGTYVKSFYSVMYTPSAVKVSEMHSRATRIHHQVTWRNAAPQIVDEKYRKASRRAES